MLPRLSASFGGRLARLSPYAAFRQDLYLGETTARVSQRGYPSVGAVLETELSHAFGGPMPIRHAIRPMLELRAVPVVFGEAPAPDDDIDVAIPEAIGLRQPGDRRLMHLVAEVRQTLIQRRGAQTLEIARLDLGQGLDLLAADLGGTLGESFGRLLLSHGPVNLFSTVRYDSAHQRLTQLSARAAVEDLAGHGISFGYERLYIEGSERTRAGIDSLLGPSAGDLALPNAHAERVSAGAHTQFKSGLGLRYDALFIRGPRHDSQVGLLEQPVVTSIFLAEQTVGLSYGPACNCWRVEAFATQRPVFSPDGQARSYRVAPDFGASLTISNFGSFGTGR